MDERQKDLNNIALTEPLYQLHVRVLQAEQERINGSRTMSIAEGRKKLKERLNADL